MPKQCKSPNMYVYFRFIASIFQYVGAYCVPKHSDSPMMYSYKTYYTSVFHIIDGISMTEQPMNPNNCFIYCVISTAPSIQKWYCTPKQTFNPNLHAKTKYVVPLFHNLDASCRPELIKKNKFHAFTMFNT